MPKTSTGYDKSRLDDPKENQEESPKQYFSFREGWANVVRLMEREGYLIKPEIGGQFCGHSVYIKEHQIPIKGLEASEGFWFWRKISPKEVSGLYKMFQGVVEDILSTPEKHQYKVYFDILTAFIDRPGDTKTSVALIGQSQSIFNAIEDTSKPATLNGTSGFFKVVPKLSWFPQSLQSYDARKLLTLLPDAEARQLMLILGRIVVGATGSRIAESDRPIEHTARSYGIIVGTEAGLGKSTLMGYIVAALAALGYSVTNLHINDTKFGWGSIAQSDLAYIDDLTEDLQKRLLADPRVKSIVSNNNLKVEDKGLQAQDIRATSVLLGCTNKHNPAHYIGMDSGSISRVNQLDTFTSEELKRFWGKDKDYKTKPFWEATAKEHKCSTECLAAYLLYRSAEYFLSTCGYSWDEHGRLFKTSKDQLESITKDNRRNFRIDTSLRHAEELVEVTAHAVALAIAESPEHRQKIMLNDLEVLDFSSSLLLAVMRLFSNTKRSNSLPEPYLNLELLNASWDCKDFISKKISELERLSSVQNSEKAFYTLISELRSTKGFGYPQKISHYTPDWMALKRQIPVLVDGYSQVITEVPITKGLQVLVSEVQKIFTELQ